MSQDRLDLLDYYTLLGVARDASPDQIRQAFHTFALKFHPDNHSESAEKLRRATQIFRRGAEAYRILRDPAARKAYDSGLQTGKLRLGAEDHPDAAGGARRPGSSAKTVKNRQARPFWTKAKRAIKAEDWQQAKLNLKIAMQHEPESELLQENLEMVEAKLAEKKQRRG